jgi:hypothetical protein
MIKIDEYFDLIKPHVLGCPESVIRKQVIIALRETCERAGVWLHEMADLYLLPEINIYQLSSPAKTEVVAVNSMRINGRPISAEVPPGYSLGNGAVQFFQHLIATDDIEVFPVPGEEQIAKVRLQLKPAFGATEVPDKVFGETYDFICFGVLYRLFKIKDQPWSSQERSKDNYNLFEDAMASLKKKALLGATPANLRVTAPRFV